MSVSVQMLDEAGEFSPDKIMLSDIVDAEACSFLADETAHVFASHAPSPNLRQPCGPCCTLRLSIR